MAKLIKANGMVSEVAPKDGSKFTLTELQWFVGGYIEYVRVPGGGWDMLANEDGLMKELPINITASGLAGVKIVGDVLLLTRGEWE